MAGPLLWTRLRSGFFIAWPRSLSFYALFHSLGLSPHLWADTHTPVKSNVGEIDICKKLTAPCGRAREALTSGVCPKKAVFSHCCARVPF